MITFTSARQMKNIYCKQGLNHVAYLPDSPGFMASATLSGLKAEEEWKKQKRRRVINHEKDIGIHED